MISFNFIQLHCFVVSAETGSFSAAARQLEKAQSGISTTVANLEIDLGVQLFNRKNKYLELTDQGKALLIEARGVLKGGERLRKKALAYSAKEDTHICLALDEALYPEFINTILPDFEKMFPYTELDLLSGIFNDVEDDVATGKADIGLLISAGMPRKTQTYKLLAYVPFQAIVSANHVFAKKVEVPMNDLETERQIIVTSRGKRDTEVTHFSQKNWLVDSYSTCASLVQQRQGWAFVPTCVLDNLTIKYGIVPFSLDLEQREHLSPLYLIKNENNEFGKSGQWLLTQLGKYKIR